MELFHACVAFFGGVGQHKHNSFLLGLIQPSSLTTPQTWFPYPGKIEDQHCDKLGSGCGSVGRFLASEICSSNSLNWQSELTFNCSENKRCQEWPYLKS